MQSTIVRLQRQRSQGPRYIEARRIFPLQTRVVFVALVFLILLLFSSPVCIFLINNLFINQRSLLPILSSGADQ